MPREFDEDDRSARRKVKQVMIPDLDYDDMMCQVMALPPKKRKHWKGYSRDKRNVKTRIRYYEGKLQSYDLWIHKFVDIVCPRQLDMSDFTPTSIVGVAQLLAIEFDEPRIYEDAYREAQKENTTGNHYRNHTVKVSPQVYGRRC
eukprot:SAG11_NODE_8141_length_1055_cov_1.572176_1_plen_145_part_00